MVDFLVRKPSEIHGMGVFTSKGIAGDEMFYEVPIDNILNCAKRRCAYVGNGIWVSDVFVLNYVNHSCEPSAILDVSSGVPKLVAVKDIKGGDEITVDYNATKTNGVDVPCSCGSEKCRGVFLRIE